MKIYDMVVVSREIDAGETEALVMALEKEADLILLDDMEASALSYIFCRFHNKVIPAKAGIQKDREKARSRIKSGMTDSRLKCLLLPTFKV